MSSENTSNQRRSSIGAKKNPQTELAILDAAADLIAENGIAGLKMEAVARKAKAGKATLYRWWPTRGALLLAVYQKNKPDLCYLDTGSLKGDIDHFSRELRAIWAEDFGLFFKAIIAEAQSDPDVALVLRQYQEERLDALTAVFERAKQRGELDSTSDAPARAELLMGIMWLRLVTNRLDEPIEDHLTLLSHP